MSSFDEKAATWDEDPTRLERAKAVARSIRAAVPLSRSTRVLEYGAGTGLVSQELASGVGPLTLADPSAGMRGVIRSKIDAGVLPGSTRVWDLDLSTGEPPPEQFDLIATVMTLHHIHDLAPVLAGFVAMLDDGGRLCLADLVKEDGSFHSDPGFDGHHGFDLEELAGQLEAVHLADVHVELVHDVMKNGRAYPVFLATCAKSG